MSVAVARYQNFVGGQWVDAVEGATTEIINPASGEAIGEVSQGLAGDVDRAVEAAKKAWSEWRDATPGERAEALLKLADVIDEHTEELAQIESQKVGKPLSYARRRDAGLQRQHPLFRRSGTDPRGTRDRRVHDGLHIDDLARADRRSPSARSSRTS